MGSWSRPRRWVLIGVVALVVCAAALLVTATVGPDRPGPLPQAGEADPVRPSMSPILASRRPTPAHLLTAEEARDLGSTPWRLSALHHRGRVLDIWFVVGSGSCDDARGVYVKESDTRVLIGTYVHDCGAEARSADLRMGYASVSLSRPLGQRALVHTVVTYEADLADAAFS